MMALFGTWGVSIAGPQASRTRPLKGVDRCLPPHLYILKSCLCSKIFNDYHWIMIYQIKYWSIHKIRIRLTWLFGVMGLHGQIYLVSIITIRLAKRYNEG